MATGVSKPDEFKEFNERSKVIESLLKEETALMEKLSQSDGKTDPAVKAQWALDLSNTIKVITKLRDANAKFVSDQAK